MTGSNVKANESDNETIRSINIIKNLKKLTNKTPRYLNTATPIEVANSRKNSQTKQNQTEEENEKSKFINSQS
jgi:hypothetical protein